MATGPNLSYIDPVYILFSVGFPTVERYRAGTGGV